MPPFPDPRVVVQSQDEATAQWHTSDAMPATETGVAGTLLKLHRANFELWHLEDAARDPHAEDSAIVACKRAIDRTNQHRNDCVEHIDTALLALATQSEGAPLHTETPGMIFDRLSILSLKLFHTAEEAERTTATAEHRARNADRLSVLQAQRADLATALSTLFRQVFAGERRFKLYRQLKMYNDPELNPVLYRGDSR